jgi:hypothetical protein
VDELDRKLDAVLAKYSAVDPRDGLEERILAGLKQSTQVAQQAWWRFGVAAAAAIVLVMVILTGRVEKPSHPTIASHTVGDVSHSPVLTAQPANGITKAQQPVGTAEVRHHVAKQFRLTAVAAAVPKLDQFPSPQPLSEQEKLALEYVHEFPKEAVLIARAQTAREQEEQNTNSSQPAEDWPGEGKQE